MKRKNGINLMFFVIIINFIMILSCTNNDNGYKSGTLMQTDRDFSALSVQEGMFKAFLAFIADDGVILRDNSLPSKGKETLRQYYSGKCDTTFVLSWDPVYEKISGSGELGYTIGIWTNTLKTTKKVSKGTYITIWQKQEDGTWKFVLDTGTQGLPDCPKE
jgi:ketosteroid isomerase-like protein